MNSFIVNGGKKLQGEVTPHGAKNSALPILTATLLIKGETVLHNCPDISDIRNTLYILSTLGCKVSQEGRTVTVNAFDVSSSYISEENMRLMRSSITFLGALISRTGTASIYYPGGCEIGLRPIDLHIKALRALGVSIEENGSAINCTCNEIKGSKVILPFPSVGATESIIIASAISKATTTIINAAREPEIIDLVSFLNSCGAKIKGAGETVIEIEGVDSLYPCEHTIMFDRIAASTFMSAAAITGSDIYINSVQYSALAPLFPSFLEMGCELYLNGGTLRVISPRRLNSVRIIKTMPFPGFPTDSQSVVVSALATAAGTSVMQENIFENRFRFVSELNRFGADIQLNGKLAIIKGVRGLQSASVRATDLRGGAALVIAALAAGGESEISHIDYIDRGYELLEKSLSELGADIKRINYETEECKKE